MATLTESRFQKAKPILDRYNEQLFRDHKLDDSRFERDLKDVWSLGYQSLKHLIIDLSKRPRYTALAARYMEGGSPGVVMEFQQVLAKLYGIPHFHHEDRDRAKAAFWNEQYARGLVDTED